jgi:hypothetical protein
MSIEWLNLHEVSKIDKLLEGKGTVRVTGLKEGRNMEESAKDYSIST